MKWVMIQSESWSELPDESQFIVSSKVNHDSKWVVKWVAIQSESQGGVNHDPMWVTKWITIQHQSPSEWWFKLSHKVNCKVSCKVNHKNMVLSGWSINRIWIADTNNLWLTIYFLYYRDGRCNYGCILQNRESV